MWEGKCTSAYVLSYDLVEFLLVTVRLKVKPQTFADGMMIGV